VSGVNIRVRAVCELSANRKKFFSNYFCCVRNPSLSLLSIIRPRPPRPQDSIIANKNKKREEIVKRAIAKRAAAPAPAASKWQPELIEGSEAATPFESAPFRKLPWLAADDVENVCLRRTLEASHGVPFDVDPTANNTQRKPPSKPMDTDAVLLAARDKPRISFAAFLGALEAQLKQTEV